MKCLALYRFALLYNLPVLNVFGYFSLVVWGLFKTLWLSAFVWLMLSVEVLLFFYDVGGSAVWVAALGAMSPHCSCSLLPGCTGF